MPLADTHTLRPKSELFDLRVGYVNRLSYAETTKPLQIQGLHLQNKEKKNPKRDSLFFGGAGRI